MSTNKNETRKVKVSISGLQIGFCIGFSKAKRIFEQLIADNVITKEEDGNYYYYLKDEEK